MSAKKKEPHSRTKSARTDHLLCLNKTANARPRLKDTLQAEASDVRLDEVQVLVSVIVLLLQRADGVALRRGWQVGVQPRYC